MCMAASPRFPRPLGNPKPAQNPPVQPIPRRRGAGCPPEAPPAAGAGQARTRACGDANHTPPVIAWPCSGMSVDVDTVDGAVYTTDDDFMPIHAQTRAVPPVVRSLALRAHRR